MLRNLLHYLVPYLEKFFDDVKNTNNYNGVFGNVHNGNSSKLFIFPFLGHRHGHRRQHYQESGVKSQIHDVSLPTYIPPD